MRAATRSLFEIEHDQFRETVRTFVGREITPNLECWDEDSRGLQPTGRLALRTGRDEPISPKRLTNYPIWIRSSPQNANHVIPIGKLRFRKV